MIRDLKSFCLGRRMLPGSILTAAFVFGIPGYALQAGRGQNPGGDAETQRTQQYDQNQQLQQQQQQDQALRHPVDDLQDLQMRIWHLDAERIRLKLMLQENFRKHYVIIRRNTVQLVQLTSTLQAILESNGDPPRTRELVDQAGRMQKLAHEIRENMGGGRVPRAKPLAISTLGISAENTVDDKQVLEASVNAATSAAAQLKSAVENYLASDNEQAVSVTGLQKASDKDHFDPNSLSILSNSLKLEQLAREIRSKANALTAGH